MGAAELLVVAKAALAEGDLDAAESAGRKVLKSDPANADALLLLGVVSIRSGDNSTGLNYLYAHLQASPDSVEGHSTTANVLFRMSQPADARKHARLAMALDPTNSVPLAGFVRDLANSSCISEADQTLDQAIRDHIEDQTFLEGLSNSLISFDKARFAVRALERAVTANPDAFAPWLQLAELKLKSNDFAAAVTCSREAVRCDPTSVAALATLALALAGSGAKVEAARTFERTLELDPNDVDALFGLGLFHQQEGDLEEAKELLRRAVAGRPTHGAAQYSLTRLYKVTEEAGEKLERLENLAENTTLHLIDRSYLYHAVGKGREDLGEYERAMDAYDAGAALGFEFWNPRAPWSRERERQFSARMTALATSEFISEVQSRGLDSKAPVFIVGMPRSGTSLVEQILSSHPEVFGAGEVFFWFEPIRKLIHGRTIDAAGLLGTAIQYLETLHQSAEGAKRITDKMPQNYLVLGLICAALPNARVIHVRRDPIDTCLSIYTTAFGEPAIYSHRREDIVFAYREYLRLMEHWREVLPAGQMIEVDYEELVSENESTTRRMIDFLGLPWDVKCLHHDKNARPVETSSVWQVRQPIYTNSVKRSERFRPWLGEFLALEDR